MHQNDREVFEFLFKAMLNKDILGKVVFKFKYIAWSGT